MIPCRFEKLKWFWGIFILFALVAGKGRTEPTSSEIEATQIGDNETDQDLSTVSDADDSANGVSQVADRRMSLWDFFLNNNNQKNDDQQQVALPQQAQIQVQQPQPNQVMFTRDSSFPNPNGGLISRILLARRMSRLQRLSTRLQLIPMVLGLMQRSQQAQQIIPQQQQQGLVYLNNRAGPLYDDYNPSDVMNNFGRGPIFQNSTAEKNTNSRDRNNGDQQVQQSQGYYHVGAEPQYYDNDIPSQKYQQSNFKNNFDDFNADQNVRTKVKNLFDQQSQNFQQQQQPFRDYQQQQPLTNFQNQQQPLGDYQQQQPLISFQQQQQPLNNFQQPQPLGDYQQQQPLTNFQQQQPLSNFRQQPQPLGDYQQQQPLINFQQQQQPLGDYQQQQQPLTNFQQQQQPLTNFQQQQQPLTNVQQQQQQLNNQIQPQSKETYEQQQQSSNPGSQIQEGQNRGAPNRDGNGFGLNAGLGGSGINVGASANLGGGLNGGLSAGIYPNNAGVNVGGGIKLGENLGNFGINAKPVIIAAPKPVASIPLVPLGIFPKPILNLNGRMFFGAELGKGAGVKVGR